MLSRIALCADEIAPSDRRYKLKAPCNKLQAPPQQQHSSTPAAALQHSSSSSIAAICWSGETIFEPSNPAQQSSTAAAQLVPAVQQQGSVLRTVPPRCCWIAGPIACCSTPAVPASAASAGMLATVRLHPQTTHRPPHLSDCRPPPSAGLLATVRLQHHAPAPPHAKNCKLLNWTNWSSTFPVYLAAVVLSRRPAASW